MRVRKISNDVRALAEKNLQEAQTALERYKAHPTISDWQRLVARFMPEERENLKRANTAELERKCDGCKRARDWVVEVYDSAMSRLTKVEFDDEFGTQNGWLYQNCLFDIKGQYSEEEQELLVMEFADRERKNFERLKTKFQTPALREIGKVRSRIPEEIRIAVWIRDGGKCARCSSRENLEYDHIVPIARGGSDTLRNVELLCEECNRAKSDNIV